MVEVSTESNGIVGQNTAYPVASLTFASLHENQFMTGPHHGGRSKDTYSSQPQETERLLTKLLNQKML